MVCFIHPQILTNFIGDLLIVEILQIGRVHIASIIRWLASIKRSFEHLYVLNKFN